MLTLAQRLPVRHVAHLQGVTERRLWGSLNRLVGEGRAKESHHDVRFVGVDEKHVGRLGYISLFHDAELRRTLFATPGRDQGVFERFCADLAAHGGAPQAIQAVAMDLSKTFQAGSRKHLPGAALCFGSFHLVKLANEALEEVRREEVRTEDELRGIRWVTLKDARRWTMDQLTDMHWLQRSGLETARAWRMKKRLREILHEARTGSDPSHALRRWVSWARRSRVAPFKRLGATIRDHMEGILNSYRYHPEQWHRRVAHASVQAAIVRARGFRTLENLTAVIYLVTGKLAHLPKPPYRLADKATI